jgi:hypothetical protein
MTGATPNSNVKKLFWMRFINVCQTATQKSHSHTNPATVDGNWPRREPLRRWKLPSETETACTCAQRSFQKGSSSDRKKFVLGTRYLTKHISIANGTLYFLHHIFAPNMKRKIFVAYAGGNISFVVSNVLVLIWKFDNIIFLFFIYASRGTPSKCSRYSRLPRNPGWHSLVVI